MLLAHNAKSILQSSSTPGQLFALSSALTRVQSPTSGQQIFALIFAHFQAIAFPILATSSSTPVFERVFVDVCVASLLVARTSGVQHAAIHTDTHTNTEKYAFNVCARYIPVSTRRPCTFVPLQNVRIRKYRCTRDSRSSIHFHFASTIK